MPGLSLAVLAPATITRERSLMPFPYYSSVIVRNPRLGNYMSHQLQINITKRMSNGLLVNLAFTGGKKISDSTLLPVDFGLPFRSRRSWKTAFRTDSTTAS